MTITMLLPSTTMDERISTTARDDLDRQGWHLLRSAVPSGTLAGLRGAMLRAVEETALALACRGEVADPLHGVEADERLMRLWRQAPPTCSRSWRRIIASPEVFAAWQVPRLQAVMRTVLGDHLYASQVWNGRPRTPGQNVQTIGWHQDGPYLPGYRPGIDHAITAWMPLVPVDAETGCLQVASGSHRRGLLRTIPLPGGLIGIPEEALAGHELVTVSMLPGDVLLFDELTFHRALDNTSQRIRWSLDLRFASGADGGLLANEAASSLRGSGYHCRLPDGRIGRYDDWIATYRYPEEF